MLLVTGATGMFGARIVRGLLDARQPVRALVRERSRGGDLEVAGAELAVADMDRPETLPEALQGVQRVFLLSPMDDRIGTRESAVTMAAMAAGVELVIKLYGAVKHHEDPLDRLHLASIAALRDSGLRWAMLSPNSVMETSLLSQAESIKQTGAIWGCAGDGKVGLIAADDAAAAGVALMTARARCLSKRKWSPAPRSCSVRTSASVIVDRQLAMALRHVRHSKRLVVRLALDPPGGSRGTGCAPAEVRGAGLCD
jgi:uncharacterized protein YbjT (DUF2867 family)